MHPDLGLPFPPSPTAPAPARSRQSRQMTTTVRLIRIAEYAGEQRRRLWIFHSGVHSYARARPSSRVCVSSAFVGPDNALIRAVGRAKRGIVTNAFNATLIGPPKRDDTSPPDVFSSRDLITRWRFIEPTASRDRARGFRILLHLYDGKLRSRACILSSP